jgi:hypothetical protein
MTTPIDDDAAEAEIRQLERETEGLKMLTAQQDAKNEARMAKILKAAAAAAPVEKDETRRHPNELRGVEYPQETDAFELWNLSFVDNYRMFQPFMGIEFLAFVEWLKRVRRRSGERLKTFDDKMREKGRADYKAAYLNVPGAFAWINLCAAPGCRKKHAHFDHHALSRQFTGPLCNEHNTSGKRARDQFGPEHFVKMAVKAEAHLRVRGDAIAVSDRAGDDPKPIGPDGGHY